MTDLTDGTGRYCRISYDFFELGWYCRLRRKHPGLMERWYWLIRLAQNARAAGRIVTFSGDPRSAEDIALSWDRRSEEQDIQEWEAVLQDLVADRDQPLAQDEDGAYRIRRQRTWYRSPSDEPEVKSERQRQRREAARAEAKVKRGEANRREVKRSEASEGTELELGSTPSVGSPVDANGSIGRSVGQDEGDEPTPDEAEARDILAQLEDRDLHPAEVRNLRSLLAHPSPLRLAALRQAVASVEGADGIQVPIAVALARARDRLGRASPRSRPDPWANPPEPPAYARQPTAKGA